VTITVAEDLSALETALRDFQWRYTAATLLLLTALLVLQRLVLRRALRPLEGTRDELARLQRGEITTLSTNGPDEIVPLVQAFNAALQGMQRRTERSQKAAGNLAHALKAPLAVLRQLGEHPDLAAHPAVREALGSELERLEHSVQRELRRARTVGHAAPGRHVDLAEVIDELVTTLARLYADRGLAIESTLHGPLVVAVDRQDLFEVCGNLLDNACKWAQGRIRITAETTPDAVQLIIEDDGPGVADDAHAALVRRGHRLDESVPGHGLGLAIVADILAEYAGVLRLERGSDLGGLRVSASLPAQSG
jgi:signal transduction histidine kinase